MEDRRDGHATPRATLTEDRRRRADHPELTSEHRLARPRRGAGGLTAPNQCVRAHRIEQFEMSTTNWAGSRTAEEVARLRAREAEIRRECESMLTEIRGSRGPAATLSALESRRFSDFQAQLSEVSALRTEAESEAARMGNLPAGLERLSRGRPLNSAGRLAPLGFPDERMRELQAAAQRGESLRLESRDFSSAVSLLPSQLFPQVVGWQHENRLLDRLQGYTIDAPQVTFIRHDSTTGVAAPTGEGDLKPELKFVTTSITAKAVKIAANNGLSWEIINDWPAFQTYCGTELYKRLVDAESDQLLNGDGTGLNMTGFYQTPGILTHASATLGTDTHIDHFEEAIAELRTGEALAEADLIVLHPTTWSAIRRTKDAYERYIVSADPTADEANQLWGVDVLVTIANPVGKGLILDTSKLGYVAIRESLSQRIGYSGDDLVRNILRTVAEERLVLCVTRPTAVLAISNLPTTVATGKTAKADAK